MSELGLGLMSGTSLDGVDAALVEIDGPHAIRLVAFHSRSFAPTQRKAIAELIAGGSVRDVALLNRELGKWFAEVGLELLARAGIQINALNFVASHGQTVWHEPGRATLQLGCPAVLAERLATQVVSDFRARDVAAGGQGAPLVPMADVMLFGAPDHGRALLNLGGMANVTWVGRRGSTDGVIAFDTGPGVAVVDAVTRPVDPAAPFDVGGKRAARGAPAEEVLRDLLAHPYFSAPPPKSTGRETFGDPYAEGLIRRVRDCRPEASDEDCVATALALTVRSVSVQLERWLPTEPERDLVVSGGGARNPVLMKQLRQALDGWAVRPFDDEFFSGDAKEAASFAYLGWRTLHGLPGNVPAATGAEGVRVLGSVTPSG